MQTDSFPIFYVTQHKGSSLSCFIISFLLRISSQKQHQSQLDEKLQNQPEIIKGKLKQNVFKCCLKPFLVLFLRILTSPGQKQKFIELLFTEF